MEEQFDAKAPQEPGLVSRRTVLGGMVTAALTPALLGGAIPSLGDGQPTLGDPVMSPIPMPMPRTFHTVTELHDGRLLFVGGLGPGNRALASALICDPKRADWTEVHSLGMARFHHAAILLFDGRVLVTGGLNRESSPLHSVEIYNPASDSWTYGPSLFMARYGHSMSSLNQRRILVAGGLLSSPLASIEVYSVDGAD